MNILSLTVTFFILLVSCHSHTNKHHECLIDINAKLALEMKESLDNKLIYPWYPRAVDSIYGGFLSDFDAEWKPTRSDQKLVVSQARHIWATSTYGRIFATDTFKDIAKHGFKFLTRTMWDTVYGGFYMLLDKEGNALDDAYCSEKRSYGNAFAIYALSSYYLYTADPLALEWAQKTFRWLDKHARDSSTLGYYDMITEKGEWLYKTDYQSKTYDMIRAQWKDHNSSIHILEAYTQLYQAWPNDTLRSRLEEMLHIVRDLIVSEEGYLHLYSYPDWSPVSYRDSSETIRKSHHYYDHISFGHDVETAFLMLEASHVLGIENDTVTNRVAKKLIDHSLANGWDEEYGGMYYAGYYSKSADTIAITDSSKDWWVQAEALNTLLLMSQLYPKEKLYRQKFDQTWSYITKYIIDHKNKGWYHKGLDRTAEAEAWPKASIWKVNYHNSRALMNCIKMLEK